MIFKYKLILAFFVPKVGVQQTPHRDKITLKLFNERWIIF